MSKNTKIILMFIFVIGLAAILNEYRNQSSENPFSTNPDSSAYEFRGVVTYFENGYLVMRGKVDALEAIGQGTPGNRIVTVSYDENTRYVRNSSSAEMSTSTQGSFFPIPGESIKQENVSFEEFRSDVEDSELIVSARSYMDIRGTKHFPATYISYTLIKQN